MFSPQKSSAFFPQGKKEACQRKNKSLIYSNWMSQRSTVYSKDDFILFSNINKHLENIPVAICLCKFHGNAENIISLGFIMHKH